MTSEYNDIFSIFLGRITDYEFMKLDKNDANYLMREFLHATAARPFLRKLFNSFSFDDDMEEVVYEVRNSLGEDFDSEFVPQVLARGMVVEWLEPRVKSVLHINQMFGGKEQKYFSQAQHLSELNKTLQNEKEEVRKMIRDYPYANFAMNGNAT